MSRLSRARFVSLLSISILALLLVACSASTVEVKVPPTPTTAPLQQPAPAATASAGQKAAPSATAIARVVTARAAQKVETKGKYGGIALFSHRGDIGQPDAMYTGTISTHNPEHAIFGDGAIVKPCRENVFTICPGLASEWSSSSDFITWTFKIRDDVKWHDGTKLTASDIKFWMEVAINGYEDIRKPANWASRLGNVKSVEAPSDTSLIITLNGPSTFYLDSLGDGSNIMQHPKHLTEPELKKGNGTVGPDEIGWIGVGPFAFTEYRRGSVIKAEKFGDYWEKNGADQLPYLDGITWPIIGDTNTMTAAFRAGRIDMTARGGGFDLTPEQMTAIKNDMGEDKVYFVGWQAVAEGLTPNASVAPWDDVRVRKALFLWLDRDAGCIAVLGGNCAVTPLHALNSPWLNEDYLEWPGFNPATKEQDRAEAKRLLTEAGYPNGFKSVIMCRSAWIFFCEFGEQQMRGLLGDGNVSIDVVDDATRDDRICKGDFSINLHGGLGGDQFPETMQPSFSTTNECANVKSHDTHVDDLFAQLAVVPNMEERVRIAKEIERYVGPEKAYVSQFWKVLKNIGVRSYVKGFYAPSVGQNNNLDHATVWLDK